MIPGTAKAGSVADAGEPASALYTKDYGRTAHYNPRSFAGGANCHLRLARDLLAGRGTRTRPDAQQQFWFRASERPPGGYRSVHGRHTATAQCPPCKSA
jgi:hypothetical protein